jgi:hypothetical protein
MNFSILSLAVLFALLAAESFMTILHLEIRLHGQSIDNKSTLR